MNDIGREGADHAAEYLGAIKGTWPLLLLVGGVAFASALVVRRVVSVNCD